MVMSVNKIHVLAVVALVAFIGFMWGPEYAIVVALVLVWVETLALLIVGTIERSKDIRALQLEQLRQYRVDRALEGLEPVLDDDQPHLRPVP